MFDLLVETRGGVAILRPHGNLFMRESEIMEARATELLRANYDRFVINLSGVLYIGSSGIGALVWLYNQLQKTGGRMVTTDVPDKVLEVLRLMELSMLETMESESDALAALGAGGQSNSEPG